MVRSECKRSPKVRFYLRQIMHAVLGTISRQYCVLPSAVLISIIRYGIRFLYGKLGCVMSGLKMSGQVKRNKTCN